MLQILQSPWWLRYPHSIINVPCRAPRAWIILRWAMNNLIASLQATVPLHVERYKQSMTMSTNQLEPCTANLAQIKRLILTNMYAGHKTPPLNWKKIGAKKSNILRNILLIKNPSTCCYNFNLPEMVTSAVLKLQRTPSTCINMAKHQSTQRYTRQSQRLENLKRPKSINCSQRASSNSH